jgi:hypothetical protein
MALTLLHPVVVSHDKQNLSDKTERLHIGKAGGRRKSDLPNLPKTLGKCRKQPQVWRFHPPFLSGHWLIFVTSAKGQAGHKFR